MTFEDPTDDSVQQIEPLVQAVATRTVAPTLVFFL